MIHVLHFSDKAVRARLFALVDGTRGLLLATALRQGPGDAPAEARLPFRALEEAHGGKLTQVLVVDEGTPEGMWRDPLGDLADRLYPDAREQSYAAAHGYVLLRDGAVLQVVRKQGQGELDGEALARALGFSGPRAPRPPPAPVAAAVEDPWALLGIAPGTPLPDARRAFRALVARYHPDKVSHLGPEFQELAERKTRALMDAWEAIARAR